eukprot:3362616-Amphidinium_carterae.1
MCSKSPKGTGGGGCICGWALFQYECNGMVVGRGLRAKLLRIRMTVGFVPSALVTEAARPSILSRLSLAMSSLQSSSHVQSEQKDCIMLSDSMWSVDHRRSIKV